MLINLRNALMAGKRLPYDAEVEYLESTGTQWIDTGSPLNLQHSIRCIFYETNTSTYFPGVVSGRGSPAHLRTYTILSPRFDYWNGNDVSPSANVLTLTRGIYTDFKTEVSTSENRLYRYVNGVKSYTTLQSGFTPNNIWLFRDHNNADLFIGRLYCYQELDGTTLVRDYIPVRKGTVGYLYDRVSGKLFGNAGTGDFVLGPDVVPVEYIESHGTQYIDTGIVPTTTKTEITFSTPTPPSSGYMCGSFNANNNRYYPAAFSGASTRYINLINAANTVISRYTNDGNVHTVVYNATGGACYFDGVAAGTLSTTTLTASNPIYLFCASGASGFVSGRIYSCKLYDANDTPVRKFRPVRVGNEGAMMDVLTRRIYRNAGRGAFTYGNDLKYPIPAE